MYGQINKIIVGRLLHLSGAISFSCTIVSISCEIYLGVYIGSEAPTDISAMQTGVPGTVVVSWTAPTTSPGNGYQIQMTRMQTSADFNVMAGSTTHTITNQQVGLYNVRVIALTVHFPAVSDPVDITVRGEPDM